METHLLHYPPEHFLKTESISYSPSATGYPLSHFKTNSNIVILLVHTMNVCSNLRYFSEGLTFRKRVSQLNKNGHVCSHKMMDTIPSED